MMSCRIAFSMVFAAAVLLGPAVPAQVAVEPPAAGSSIEVHLSLTRFVNQYELTFHKGDLLEVTGVKLKFEGVDTIFRTQDQARRG